jgi:hypothetical protein
MNEFLPRTEPIASVASVQTRVVGQQAAASGIKAGEHSAVQPAQTERPAATANYARIQADIARALQAVQNRQPVASAGDLGQAETAMMDLMPQPIVMLPMPPADAQMVEFVAQIAQSLAQQAVRTHAAQARISASTVNALVG